MRIFFHQFLFFLCIGAISGFAQPKSAVSTFGQIAESSDVIVVGKITSGAPIIRNDKLTVTHGNGNTRYSTPSELELGVEFEIEATRWLKSTGKIRMKKTIRIIVPGQMTTDSPFLLIGKTYLVFLKKAELNEEEYKNAIVVRSTSSITAKENTFTRSEYYGIVGGRRGYTRNEQKIRDFVQNYDTNPD